MLNTSNIYGYRYWPGVALLLVTGRSGRQVRQATQHINERLSATVSKIKHNNQQTLVQTFLCGRNDMHNPDGRKGIARNSFRVFGQMVRSNDPLSSKTTVIPRGLVVNSLAGGRRADKRSRDVYFMDWYSGTNSPVPAKQGPTASRHYESA